MKYAYWYNRQYKYWAASIILYTFIYCNTAQAQPVTYTPDQIADAIYKAEASKARPYGIMQRYKTTTPRQACLNTIKHARRDYNGPADGFILFLSRRYAPIGAENDPRNLNKNWYKNVMYFLNQAQITTSKHMNRPGIGGPRPI